LEFSAPISLTSKAILGEKTISVFKWPPYSLGIVPSDICAPNIKAFFEKNVSAVI
jgi:hypothetical protein